jgi:hypothetical protein
VSFENDVTASPLVGNGVVRNGAQVGRVADNAAQVIPAKLEVRPEVSLPIIARSVVPKFAVPRSVVPGTSKPVVITAKADQREMVQSMPIRGTEAVQAVAPRTLILVMRTEFVQTRFVRTQFVETGGDEGSGSVVWNLCVWQVTVIGPVQNRTQQENTAKSI